MSVPLRLPRLGLLDIFEGPLASHLVAHFGAMPTERTTRRAAETLAIMPAHLRDDAGLPPVSAEEPEHPAITTARSHGRNWG